MTAPFVPPARDIVEHADSRIRQLAQDDPLIYACLRLFEREELSAEERWAYLAVQLAERSKILLKQNVKLAMMQPAPVYLVPPYGSATEEAQ